MPNIKTNRLYRIWGHIKTRCFNPNYENFHRYGGRGITMCDEWRNNFRSFERWALCNGYHEKLSIDRINNDGNYEPSNCRWVSQSEQNKNTTANRKFNGKCISDWAKELGIDCDLIYARINRLGWDIEKAIFTPASKTVRKRRKGADNDAR